MNRTQRRIYNKEAAELEKLIGWIEKDFTTLLFDEACPSSYITLFRWFNGAWEMQADKWNAKPSKMIVLDREHFYNTYKPLENLKPKNK